MSRDELAFPPAFFRSWTGTVCKTGSMHEAAEKGDLAALEKHMVAGREMGYPDHETLRKRDDVLGATCLHFAAENGHHHVVKVRACLSSLLQTHIRAHIYSWASCLTPLTGSTFPGAPQYFCRPDLALCSLPSVCS